MKKTIIIITFFLICSLPQTMADEESAVFTIDAPDRVLQDGEAFNITIYCEPGDQPIDALIIKYIKWTPDGIEVLSVEPGWWGWLFDPGDIYEYHVYNIQAGQKTKTSEKQIACILHCEAQRTSKEKIPICLEGVSAISGGPSVPVETIDDFIMIEGNYGDDTDPTGNDMPYVPPGDELPTEPQDDGNDDGRNMQEIQTHTFYFSSKQLPDKDDDTDPFAGPEVVEGKDDDEDIGMPVLEIVTAIGGFIGVLLILSYIVLKRRKPKEIDEDEDEEITIGE